MQKAKGHELNVVGTIVYYRNNIPVETGVRAEMDLLDMELLYQIRKDKELNREEFYRRVMRKAGLGEIQRLMFENEYKEETFDVLITMKEKDTEGEDDSDQEVTIKKKPDENI